MRNPSGDQFEIACDDQRVVVVEVGGGLRTYTAGGQDVLAWSSPATIRLSCAEASPSSR